MNNIRSIFLFIFIFLSFSMAQDNSLRVMTYNIRYANNNPGEEWELRKSKVAEMIDFHNPDIFGVQEALFEQVEYLYTYFNNFNLVGVGRDDGHIHGEFSALFISPKFNVISSGTFWLSETPEIPSLGWDANYKRIATWAIIQNIEDEDSMFVINTHLDHEGIIARLKSTELIMNQIEKLSNGLQVILLGDFNFTSEFEGYDYIINNGILQDSEKIAQNIYGTNITFNGFQNILEEKHKIDHIFVSNDIIVQHHAIIGDKFDGVYPSDHMPVIIDFTLPRSKE